MKKMQKVTKKRVRTFSPEFKKEKVAMIEEGKMTVVQLSRLYNVTRPSVYAWIKRNMVSFHGQNE